MHFAPVFLSLLAVVAAKPAARMSRHESREAAPSGYLNMGPANGSDLVKLRIALKQNNMDGLIKSLYDVSTPSNAKYGQHLSKEEVEKLVAPSPETVQLVTEWLQSHGVSAQNITAAGDWLSFSVPVSKAQDMFDANFELYQHGDSGRKVVRTMAYSIPTHLKGHVELMYPGISFPSGSNQKVVLSPRANNVDLFVRPGSDATVPSSCARTVTPACLEALYGIPTTAATQGSKNQIAVSGYDDQYANAADLKSFLTKFRSDTSSATTFTLQTLDGGSNPQSSSEAGIEANLDVQMTVGLATKVPTVFLSVGEQNQDGDLEGFLDTVNFLLGETAPPQVLTTSYGPNEGDVSRALTNNLCNAYAQISARGTSVLYASGDGGVSGTQSSSCSKFVVTFPSGCPYVTVVGGTTGVAPEVGASLSSGGFSNYFGIPSFQSTVVASYLKALGSTNSGKFNASGRAYPDVAAQAESVTIYLSGSQTPVDGTSCSSPIFAAIIGLLNDKLIAAGKSTLGWLNPFIYANPQAFNDITSGSNPGCNTQGFPAKAGWDPVTGLGSPNFAKLQAAAGV